MSISTPLFELNHDFDSYEQAMESLVNAASAKGFAVTISDSHRQDTNNPKDTRRSFFVLSCIQGKNRSGYTPKKMGRKRNCPFKIRVKDHVIKDEKGNDVKAVWRITKMEANHSHMFLTQEEMNNFSSFRAMSEATTISSVELMKKGASNTTVAEQMTDYKQNKIVLPKDVAALRAKLGFIADSTIDTVRPLLMEMEQCGYYVRALFNDARELTHLFFIHQNSIEMVRLNITRKL